jgi:hypothetical protein
LSEIIEEAETERRNYVRFAAQGRMTDAELDAALSETDERKHVAERELAATQEDANLAREMEVLRDMLLERAPGAACGATGTRQGNRPSCTERCACA